MMEGKHFMRNLCEEFKHFEGQPVKVFTHDGRSYTGIDLNAYEDCVRIIDDCGRLILLPYRHIDAVVEPQMRLRRCCDDHHECKEDECGRDRRGGRGDCEKDCGDMEFGERF